MLSVFSAHLQDQISAHRIPCEENFLVTVADQLFADGAIVRTHAGVVKGGSEGFAATAIALIQADGVESALERCLSDAARVIRIAGTLQTVNNYDHRRPQPVSRLPMAARQQLGFRIDLEQAVFRRRQIKPSAPEHRCNGHDVRAAKQRMRMESVEHYKH